MPASLVMSFRPVGHAPKSERKGTLRRRSPRATHATTTSSSAPVSAYRMRRTGSDPFDAADADACAPFWTGARGLIVAESGRTAPHIENARIPRTSTRVCQAGATPRGLRAVDNTASTWFSLFGAGSSSAGSGDSTGADCLTSESTGSLCSMQSAYESGNRFAQLRRQILIPGQRSVAGRADADTGFSTR